MFILRLEVNLDFNINLFYYISIDFVFMSNNISGYIWCEFLTSMKYCINTIWSCIGKKLFNYFNLINLKV